ncbi:restriction endonuclease subunit S [Hoylesella timonensis]|uniref:restriction endonuclease subunit S n=1 Tax=Hoylesella timonensis TaxID=386414 RepID=UPI000ADED086|nr:restriction endonuclease subunit S [Hoylesella timonensis]
MNGKQLKNSILQWAIQGKLVPPVCRQAGKTLMTNPEPRDKGKECWFTYVIECEDGSFYKGFTDNLLRRYQQHCNGTGADYTKTHKPKQLYYWEMHYSKEAALQREKYLKSGAGREWFKKEVVDKPENFEPASVLLEKIRQEKERLIKEKKIKRDKNASIIYRGDDNSYYEKILATGEVKCIDEEVPFEIPQGWEWCRVSSLFQINPKVVADDNTSAAFIPMEAISAGYGSEFRYYEKKWGEIKSGYTAFADNDIAFAKITPCFQNRKSAIFEGLPNGIGAGTTELKVLRTYGDTINRWFVLYFLESPYFIDEATFKGTANQQRIIVGYLENKLFPIPPLAEQERIVSKIRLLMPIIDKYSKSQEHLDKINAELKEYLKKSILQEAIQGKLVPQVDSEGTAKELLEQIKLEKQKLVKEGKLKKSALNDSVIFRGDDNKYWEKLDDETECIDEEISFEIPPNWTWVRLDDICSFIHRGKSPKYSLIKKYPVVAQKCNQWSGFSIEKAKFIEPQSISSYKEEYILQDEDLMWNSTGLGTLGRMAIYYKKLNPYELAVADSHVTVIRPYKQYVVSKFLYYYFASNTVQSVIEDKSDGSTKQKELSTKTVKSYLVPLPPKEEQKRIVVKIKKLTQLLK